MNKIMNMINFNSPQYEILKAYSLLEKVTPLSCDCGKQCGGKCCKGSEADGMWLFPYEAELLNKSKDFKIAECCENMNNPKLICTGKCDRRLRPLGCRMFPLFPYAFRNRQGQIIIKVLPDIRASEICPLEDKDITPEFYRAVRIAGAALIRNKVIAEYLVDLTELLTYNPF